MKTVKYLVLLFFVVSCTATIPAIEIGQSNSELSFVKINMDYGSYNYEMMVPELIQNEYTFFQSYGGHGHGFQFGYSDSSILYFKNDWVVGSSNYNNYKTIGFTSPDRYSEIDTTISGVLPNGLFWKEIIKGEDYLGYVNVSKERLPFFNKSLDTFRKVKAQKTK